MMRITTTISVLFLLALAGCSSGASDPESAALTKALVESGLTDAQATCFTKTMKAALTPEKFSEFVKFYTSGEKDPIYMLGMVPVLVEIQGKCK
jgi:hypothetical protein